MIRQTPPKLLADSFRRLTPSQKAERAFVFSFLRFMAGMDWRPLSVHTSDAIQDVVSIKDAMEILFSSDGQVSVRLRKGMSAHHIGLVFCAGWGTGILRDWYQENLPRWAEPDSMFRLEMENIIENYKRACEHDSQVAV